VPRRPTWQRRRRPSRSSNVLQTSLVISLINSTHVSHLRVITASGDVQAPSDDKLAEIENRLSSLVEGRDNGVWSTQLEKEYTKKYNKILPTNWPTKLLQCKDKLSKIAIEPSCVANRFILTPIQKKEEEQMEAGNGGGDAPQVPKADLPNGELEVREKVPEEAIVVFPNLPYPGPEDFWNIYITNVESANKVFGRLLGENTSEAFEEMVTDMEMHYRYEEQPVDVEQVVIGRYFVANRFESEWYRVQVRELMRTQVRLWCLDTGETIVIEVDALRPLLDRFTKLAPQAFCFSLHGLSDLPEDDVMINGEIDRRLSGGSYVGEIVPTSDGSICMLLNDTSTDEDIGINTVIKCHLWIHYDSDYLRC